MITETSFFKNIPASITLEQRLIWEGAGWAIGAISWSFDRLKQAALQIDLDDKRSRSDLVREIFACCWSIIDQSHMLRELLKRSQPREDGPTDKFIKKIEAVTLIRNAMDHLHKNIKNIANAKDARPPLFGVLSFCFVKDRHLTKNSNGETVMTGCAVVSMTAGALTHPQHHWRAINPMGRLMEVPVGLFLFQAFEYTVSFSELMTDLAALVRHYDTTVKADQELQLRQFARANGLDEGKVVTEHLAGDLFAFIEMEFEPTRLSGE
jgi:hypothetical protein